MSSILTIEELRIIIYNYNPPKPEETNYLAFMNENFSQTLFELLLKYSTDSFKNLTGQINDNISFPNLPNLLFPSISKNEGPDPSYYDGTESNNNVNNNNVNYSQLQSRSQSTFEDTNRISNTPLSQRQSEYNNIIYNPSSGNIYGTQFTETPTYIYYEDILRRLYMINDYFF